MAVQSRVNGTLGAATHTPILAAVVSFNVGLVLLVLAAVLPAPRAALVRLITAVKAGKIRPWETLGGVIGGIFVAVQTAVVPSLGVALFVILVVGAQTLGGMAVDHLGFGPRGKSPITPVRFIASLIAVGGVIVSALGRSGAVATFAVGAALAAFAIGVGTQVQQALNGRVTARVRSPYATTTQNFTVGLIALLVIATVEIAFGGKAFEMPHDVPWWAWTGGVLGMGFIGLTAWATKHLSVLVLGLMVIAGQLVAATALDLATPATRHLVSAQVVLGMVITGLGAALAALSGVVTARLRRVGS